MPAPIFIDAAPRLSGSKGWSRLSGAAVAIEERLAGATIAIESAGLSGLGSSAADSMYGQGLDTGSLAGKLYVASPMLAAGGLLGGVGMLVAGKKKTGVALGLIGIASAIYYGTVRNMAANMGA